MSANGRRPSITAAIIARDEAARIGDCLDCLQWAEERLVVLDAATRDETERTAVEHGARVVPRAFETFATQRDFALDTATGEWVLFVDADERISAALRDEVLQAVGDPGERVGFWIPRQNVVFGCSLQGGGWYPDPQLRLLKRGKARYDPLRGVHEIPLLDGAAGRLVEPIVHLSYETVDEFIRKQERYARLEAQRWLATYGRPRFRAVIGQPVREFYRRFVQLKGYRDGYVGFVLAVLTAWFVGKAVWMAYTRGDSLRQSA